MNLAQLRIGLLTLCLAVLSAAGSAWAYPAFGTGVDGNCYFCHSTIVNDRMELLDYTGLVDPVERQGVPDQGELKYYSAPAGGSVGMSMRAIDGTENYAFQIIGFDDEEVTQGGTLVYDDDPAWLVFRGANWPTYFVRADGEYDGYDWGTSDPTQVTYDIQVDAATPPGYYLLLFALVGRDVQRDGWYHSELFYLEVTPGGGPSLTVDATCPGGGPIMISWTGATPNRTAALVYARNTGSFRIPNGYPCAGAQLGLGSNQIQIAFQGNSDSNGGRTLNANVGSGVCGGYFQLLDVASCTTSNVARAE